MALGKFTIREIGSRPGRAILTLLSVVIGVAMVVSVNVAAQTTRRANKDLYETLAGRASLEVMAEAGIPFDQAVLEKVASVPGVEAAVPLIRGKVNLTFQADAKQPAGEVGEAAAEAEGAGNEQEGGKRKKVHIQVLGIDPEKDGTVRDYSLIAGQWIDTTKSKVLLDSNFASNLGLRVHDKLRMWSRQGNRRTFTVTGLIAPRGAAAIGQGVAYMSIESAQKLFDLDGTIHTIQVVTADGANLPEIQAAILQVLPQGLVVRPPAMRTQQANERLLSTELGLTLATFFSWVLAALIVLNTFQMNVVERRRQLAILRAIGATRRQVIQAIFREGLGMGLLGTALGLMVGLGGAKLISNAMARVMQTNLPPIEISWQPLALALLGGPVVSVLGALWPAWRAGKLTPLEGMGAILPSEIEAPRWTMFLIGLAISLCGGAALFLCIRGVLPVDGTVTSTIVVLIGLILTIPMVLRPLTSIASKVFSPLLRVEGRLAEGQIVRRRGRTTLTVGVLFLAVAFGIGMAINIVDNVNDVKDWARTTITGDFFVRGMTFDTSMGEAADVPESIGPEIAEIPGVKRVMTIRYAETQVAGQPVSIIIGPFGEKDGRQLELIAGNPDTLLEEMEAGNVVIGSVLATRAKLKLGDTIPLKVLEGQKPPKIVAIANEYMAGGLAMHMRPQPAADLLGIKGLNGYVVKTEPGQVAEVGAGLKNLVQKHGLILQSQKELLTMIDNMMAAVVGCFWFLLVLVFVVAAFGVVNTLTMNVIEQTRELGLLRIVAMTRNQVRKLIVSQAALLATIGLVPGVLAGLALAWFMNQAMETLAGRPIDFDLHPVVILSCFCVAFCIVLLAAWFPANRAAKLKLAEALQYQ
ncbi:MAG: FtsX-like permease family protein [Planctomycetes bacterium]|nr:FtsX-like permease family protein [Planctomycetota bacterium]